MPKGCMFDFSLLITNIYFSSFKTMSVGNFEATGTCRFSNDVKLYQLALKTY